MFARWDAIQKVGLMDSVSYPLWGSTADWQLRFCRAGYKALPVADVPGFIHERGNRKFGDSIQSLLDKEPQLKNKLVRTPPTVSVVIACKNYGRFLPDAIHSLIGGETVMGYHPGQTFQGFEIVVVDYGSTDNTKQIMSQYTDGWQGIRFLTTPDKGTANACNVGVKAAIGKYIAMLDADDMMLPHRLEVMLRKLEANPGRVIVDSLLPFSEQGELIKYTGEHFTWRMLPYDFNQLIYKNSMHKGILYEKRAWELAGGYPEKMTAGREDWAFNVALGRVGFCGLNIKHGGYLYRRQDHNRTLRNSHRHQYFLEEIKGIFPDVYYAVGGRPTMCCGSEQKADNRNLRAQAHKTAESLLIGRDGMTSMEYVGKNAGDSTYWGEVTGQQYRFGGGRKYGYVDNRDVAGLLSIAVGGKPVFKVYVAPKTPTPAAVVANQDEAIAEPQETIAAETSVEPAETLDEAELFDPSSATATQVQAWLDTGPSKAQINLALNAEQSGKARKTVLAMLTAAVEA
jgi:glycosyltransferase involved in cell wall biosynthesis